MTVFRNILACIFFLFFFFHDPATTEIYTLCLHDALPISVPRLKSGVLAVIRPSASITALIPVLAARTIGTLVSTARIAVIASNWYGAELLPYHASLVMFTRTSAPRLTARRVRS